MWQDLPTEAFPTAYVSNDTGSDADRDHKLQAVQSTARSVRRRNGDVAHDAWNEKPISPDQPRLAAVCGG